MNIHEIVNSATQYIPYNAKTFAAIAILTVLAAAAAWLAVSLIRRRGKNTPAVDVRRVGFGQRALTYITVAVGLGYDFQGNWVAFSKMQMNAELRTVLFGFLPLLLITCAVAGRRNYLSAAEGEKPTLGVEGRAMWAIAIVSALIAATAAADTTERVARILLPVLAAWRLKRLIMGEYAQTHGVNIGKVTSWFDQQWQRIQIALVRIGWMSAENTSLEEEDRSRRMGKLASVRYRMDKLPAGKEKDKALTKWTSMINKPAYSRLLRDLVFIADLQTQLAGMYESVEETSREAVKKFSPYAASGEEANIQKARRMLDRSNAGTARPKTAAPKRTTTSPAASADARARIKEFVKSHVAEHGVVPSARSCDRAVGTNDYAKKKLPGILAELGLESPDRQDEAS